LLRKADILTCFEQYDAALRGRANRDLQVSAKD
jgi:hypothetical protein